jgi:hypothetical protein
MLETALFQSTRCVLIFASREEHEQIGHLIRIRRTAAKSLDHATPTMPPMSCMHSTLQKSTHNIAELECRTAQSITDARHITRQTEVVITDNEERMNWREQTNEDPTE